MRTGHPGASGRRCALALAALLAAGAGAGAAAGAGDVTEEAAVGAAVIHQEVVLKASPARVYAALLDAKQFGRLTGGLPTEIDPRLGGAFSCFGGHIVGRQVELVPDQRIVQAWRVVDWPAGIFSIARFELKAEGTGTRLVFDHTGFPTALKDHLAAGWEEHYWPALKALP